MRILFSFGQLGPDGGPPRCGLELAEALHHRGHEFVVAYEVADSFVPRWKAIDSQLVTVPNFVVSRWRPIRSSAGTMRGVSRVLTTTPEVVYSNVHLTLPFSALAARRLGVPLFAHITQPPPEGSRAFLAFYRRLLARASATAFISAQLRTSYEEARLVRPGAGLIPIGLDMGVYRPATKPERQRAREALAISNDDPVMLYMGRLDPDKGIETFMKAVGLMPARSRNVLIAGAATVGMTRRGSDTYAERLAASAPPGIRFIGRHDDNRAVLWAADVVAVPSVWPEPLGRVPLEAMACGIPVVASRAGGLPEIFTGELEEFLFQPGDSDELATALTSVLPGMPRRPLSDVLRSHVAEHFNLETTSSSIENMMLEAIAG